jgi:hypothetical protein
MNERSRRLARASRDKKGWVNPPFGQGQRGEPSARQPEFQEARGRLWVRPPSKVRFERDTYVYVVDGDRWWEEGLGCGPVTGQDAAIVKGKLELDHIAFMLDPSWFAGREGLVVAGPGTVGGRTAIRLKSPPPVDPTNLFPGIGWGGFSPEFELWIDAERGLLLRTVERFDGRDYQVAELLDVEFDVAIPDAVFTLVLPEGQEFRRYQDVTPQRLSLDEAAQSVPFTVFAPQSVPPVAGHWDDKVLFEPLGAWIAWSYVDQNRVPQMRLQITEESGSLEDEEDPAAYQRVELEGETMLVRSAQSQDGSWHSLQLSREGTRISIESMLDRDTSIAIARSIRPVKVRDSEEKS